MNSSQKAKLTTATIFILFPILLYLFDLINISTGLFEGTLLELLAAVVCVTIIGTFLLFLSYNVFVIISDLIEAVFFIKRG